MGSSCCLRLDLDKSPEGDLLRSEEPRAKNGSMECQPQHIVKGETVGEEIQEFRFGYITFEIKCPNRDINYATGYSLQVRS